MLSAKELKQIRDIAECHLNDETLALLDHIDTLNQKLEDTKKHLAHYLDMEMNQAARIKALQDENAELRARDRIYANQVWREDALRGEAERLEAELAQAKAAAVQWVTYDGTPGTLPANEGDAVLYAGEDGTQVVYLWKGNEWHYVEFGEGGFDVEIGDRWAYLPQPPASEG